MMSTSEQEPAVAKPALPSADRTPAPTRCTGCMHPVPFWSLILAALVGFGGYAWISEPSDMNVITFLPTIDPSDQASSVLAVDNKAGVVENCQFLYKTNNQGYIVGFVHQCCDDDSLVNIIVAEVVGKWNPPTISSCALGAVLGRPCSWTSKVVIAGFHGRDKAFLAGMANIDCLDSEWGQSKCRVEATGTLTIKDGEMALFSLEYNGRQVISANYMSPSSAGEQNTLPSPYKNVEILGLITGKWASAPTCPVESLSSGSDNSETGLSLMSLVYAV